MNLRKALVIDDEVEIGVLLSTMLNKLGIEAKYASNLTAGMQMFEELRPNVVFIDLNLPDGSGFSLIPKIKREASATRVVVITAQDGAKERAMAQHLGVDYLMPKPLNRLNIMEVLQAMS